MEVALRIYLSHNDRVSILDIGSPVKESNSPILKAFPAYGKYLESTDNYPELYYLTLGYNRHEFLD